MTYREIELAQICDNGDCNRPYLDSCCSVLIEIIIFFRQMIFYWPRRYSKLILCFNNIYSNSAKNNNNTWTSMNQKEVL